MRTGSEEPYSRRQSSTRVYPCAYQSMSSVRGEPTDGWFSVAGAGNTSGDPKCLLTWLVSLISLLMQDAQTSDYSQRFARSKSDTLITVLLQFCRRRLEPITIIRYGFRRVETESFGTHPSLNAQEMHVDIRVDRWTEFQSSAHAITVEYIIHRQKLARCNRCCSIRCQWLAAWICDVEAIGLEETIPKRNR